MPSHQPKIASQAGSQSISEGSITSQKKDTHEITTKLRIVRRVLMVLEIGIEAGYA